MRRVRAFTLIELLVAMGIIAILAVILLCVFGGARGSAQATTCRNNLRQWGQATLLYAADHDDFLPPEGKPTPLESDLTDPTYQGWYIQLPEQMNSPRYAGMPWRTNGDVEPGNSLWICPANNRRCNASSRTNNLFHYCLNDYVNGTGTGNRKVRLGWFRTYARVVWLFDSKNLPAVGEENYIHFKLHNRGAHFVFLDSHVTRFRSAECWDSTAGKGITNNPDLVWMP